jgi:hypothetical protein
VMEMGGGMGGVEMGGGGGASLTMLTLPHSLCYHSQVARREMTPIVTSRLPLSPDDQIFGQIIQSGLQKWQKRDRLLTYLLNPLQAFLSLNLSCGLQLYSIFKEARQRIGSKIWSFTLVLFAKNRACF